jgi:RimJ/RimL family protein N-acetyltransferase
MNSEHRRLAIRRYRDEDHDAVWWLHNNALRPAGDSPGNPPWDDDLHDIRHIYFPTGDFLVGELDGQIVAMGAIRRKDDGCAEVRRMRVHPAHQRRGFGQRIIDALQQRARNLGYARLVLDTTVQQVAAQRFYEKNGFVRTGRGRFGRFRVIFYEKLLV